MLDHFAIFTSGGLVLWAISIAKLKGSPVNDMIKAVLLEGKVGGADQYASGNSSLKWTRSNDYGLFFVAVYPTAVLKVQYIDQLLEMVRDSFISTNKVSLDKKEFLYDNKEYQFDKHFDAILKKAQEKVELQKIEEKKPKDFSATKKGKEVAQAGRGQKNPDKNKDPAPVPEPETSPTLPRVQSRGPPGARRPGPPKKSLSSSQPDIKEGAKRPKAKTIWDTPGSTAPKVLDLGEYDHELAKNLGVGETTCLEFSSSSSSSSSDDLEIETKSSASSGIWSYFSNFTNKELTADDLSPALEQVKSDLIAKNVAGEIAESLCKSVAAGLIGKRLGTFNRVKNAVTEAMEEAMTRILTPKRNIDILRDCRMVKEKEKRPYVITFVGINGVGKSTSLAKVVSWLKQNGQKVLIAACDTFRSAAIEQLMVHARNLDVELFHCGYGKSGGKDDPASVCKQAIQKATKEGYDVVVVDTAGRMQGNQVSMKELAKLVGTNDPDLVLFVGEALVGNDSVDQLVRFNQGLQELGSGGSSKPVRGIDGLILTKFDCVDEKVGAAVTMTHTTGKPVVFVGVGQKYPDLKTLDVKRIVSVLVK